MTTQEGAKQLLDSKTVALVAIDLQPRILAAIFEAERVINKSILMLRAAQVLSIPTILTTQYERGLGPVIPQVACAAPGIAAFDKTSFGCFGDKKFLPHLQEVSPHRTTLLVVGVEAHVCVTQTVLGALEAGYVVHVAEDATSSRTAQNWQIGLNRMERAGAVMSSTEMMICELLRNSETPEFKTILPMIK